MLFRSANTIIAGVRSSSLSETQRKHYEGVAKLNRAQQYYTLVRQYGDLQWINTVVDITDEAILYGNRISRDIVMDSVLQDLNYAAATIDDGSEKLKWTRSMANALKADICLWEGTFRKYRTKQQNDYEPDLEGSKKFLNACVDACTFVMGKSYSLNSSYMGNYNSVDLSKNPEMIFYKAYKQNILMHSVIAYTCSSTQINGLSKDVFDSYLFSDEIGRAHV